MATHAAPQKMPAETDATTPDARHEAQEETAPQGDAREARLAEAAARALAEAEERRRRSEELRLPKELGGRDGPEPVRFGDWEKKGIAYDF